MQTTKNQPGTESESHMLQLNDIHTTMQATKNQPGTESESHMLQLNDIQSPFCYLVSRQCSHTLLFTERGFSFSKEPPQCWSGERNHHTMDTTLLLTFLGSEFETPFGCVSHALWMSYRKAPSCKQVVEKRFLRIEFNCSHNMLLPQDVQEQRQKNQSRKKKRHTTFLPREIR